MKFCPGLLSVKAPVNDGLGGVALRDQSIDFPPEGLLAGEPLLQAAAGQDAELDLRPRPPPGQAMFNQLPCLGV